MAVFIPHHFLPKISDKTDCFWRNIAVISQFHLSLLSHNIIMHRKKHKVGEKHPTPSVKPKWSFIFQNVSAQSKPLGKNYSHMLSMFNKAYFWCHWRQMPLVLVCHMDKRDVTSLIRNNPNWDLSNIQLIWVHLQLECARLPVSYAYSYISCTKTK